VKCVLFLSNLRHNRNIPTKFRKNSTCETSWKSAEWQSYYSMRTDRPENIAVPVVAIRRKPQDSVYMVNFVCTQKAISGNPTSTTLESDWPHRDRFAACVVAHQYSSATFIPMCFHSSVEKFGAFSKNVTISNSNVLETSYPWYCVTRNWSVCENIGVQRNKIWTRFHEVSYRRPLQPVCTFPDRHANKATLIVFWWNTSRCA